MKVMISKGLPGFRLTRLGGIAALSLCLASGVAFAAEIADTQLAAPPPVLPWISEVVKMNDAGVPQDVIGNYVKNTRAHSTLSADDIIYLHNHNVSTTLITAMIEHGAAAQYAAPAPAVAMPTTPAPMPVYGYPSSATYAQTPPDYGSDQTQPVVNYNYYGSSDYGSSGYGYNYPYYYWYSYPYYPIYYYPFFFRNNCFRNGFHVHANGVVHSNGGFHGSSFHSGGFHTSSFSHASFAMGGGHSMGMGGMHR